VTLMGQACRLETWHTDDGWFHTKRHSKCIHLATGMAGEGFDRDSYAGAEAQAKNECTKLISAWLHRQRQEEEMRRMKEEMKKQEEARRRAEEARRRAEQDAQRRAEQLRQEEEARRRAEEQRQRAQAEAQRRAEELRQQRQQQREQLSRSRATLDSQLQEKQAEYNAAHQRVTNLSNQIASEEKAIESFRVEREDGSRKIIVTVGMTGGGKSTFCNRLNGDESTFGREGGCQTSGDGTSCTQSNGKLCVQIGQHRVTVVDTPGFGDSFGRDREHSNRLCAYLKGCGGINAFVLVRNGAQPRFDQPFQNMLRQYHDMFGQKFFDRLIIVATRIEGFIKMQYEQNNQENVLRRDVCNLFNLNNLAIPVIPIGFEQYKQSIQALVNVIPSDREQFDQVKSPIDELRIRHSTAAAEESGIMEQIARIRSDIVRVDGEMRALQ